MITLLATALVAALVAPRMLAGLPTRENYRGEALAFPGGAVAIAITLVLLGPVTVADEIDATEFQILLIGVALLGLMDDLLDASGRGLRGHARAVLRGEFSTGALKALGTASLALTAMWIAGFRDTDLVRGTLVIVLCTNLFNLLDLRPGRAWKVFLLAGAGILALGRIDPLEIVAPVAGPLLVLGFLDLRERCMLGDTGANLLGAVIGTWIVWGFGAPGEWIALGVLAALTIFGEFGSFSRAIEKLPPLRALDSLGRKSHA